MIFEEKLIILICVGLLIMYYLYRKTNNKKVEQFITRKDAFNKKSLNTPFSDDFNLDNMCKKNSKHLGWKCFWKNLQQNKLDNIVDTQIITHTTKNHLCLFKLFL